MATTSTRITSDDPRAHQGRARMRALVAEYATERQAVADGLVRDLGRTPSTAELLLIEATAAQVVEARKLRRHGKSSEMQDRLLIRALAKLGVKPGEAKAESLEAYLARTATPPSSATPACDESGGDGPDYQDSDEYTGSLPNGGAAA
jgi:hypothetical protein